MIELEIVDKIRRHRGCQLLNAMIKSPALVEDYMASGDGYQEWLEKWQPFDSPVPIQGLMVNFPDEEALNRLYEESTITASGTLRNDRHFKNLHVTAFLCFKLTKINKEIEV